MHVEYGETGAGLGLLIFPSTKVHIPILILHAVILVTYRNYVTNLSKNMLVTEEFLKVRDHRIRVFHVTIL